ncbi:hypothetical protein [Streptomyces sp. ME19-01-6]|uniref:hypothetical protein n=1 Tax=Streptomyces sp. ME19-01-6 TaxID=3028686 RepID=UPI0029A64D65|nr:hypothetical protein [Streptomyces sp. ME19-01-6]MDX3232141.1 hypothetical protein [Streptomyces sp. ME19-01-6]
MVVELPKTTARYVRLDVTRLGLPLAEGDFPALTRRLQLAEVEVRDDADPEGPDLAKGAAVTASESNTVRKTWEPALAVDGLTNSGAQTAAGYASKPHPDADVSATPVTLTLDLKQTARFDRVLLCPRADVLTADGRVPGFPVDSTVATADAATGPFTEAARVTGQTPPRPPGPGASRPYTSPYPNRGPGATHERGEPPEQEPPEHGRPAPPHAARPGRGGRGGRGPPGDCGDCGSRRGARQGHAARLRRRVRLARPRGAAQVPLVVAGRPGGPGRDRPGGRPDRRRRGSAEWRSRPSPTA